MGLLREFHLHKGYILNLEKLLKKEIKQLSIMLECNFNTLHTVHHLSGAWKFLSQCHVPLKWRSMHNKLLF